MSLMTLSVLYSAASRPICSIVSSPADGARGPHLAIMFKPAFRRFSQKGLVTRVLLASTVFPERARLHASNEKCLLKVLKVGVLA